MNLVCNNLRLRVCKWISELLVKCNVWCVMLNDAILVVSKLVWNPSWFQLTTGIIWAQVRKFERFGACFCTCALIIWSVLLHRPKPNHGPLRTSVPHRHWGLIFTVDQSRFDPRALVHPIGLYKQSCTPWDSHPETLIHMFQSGSIERGPMKGSTSQEPAFKRD
jgi:hypothetical protein